MIVTLDEIKWETFCTGDHIFSRMSESYREKANNTELSIAYTTFQNRYIRRAKNDISADTAI
jgi:hypothetical protein